VQPVELLLQRRVALALEARIAVLGPGGPGDVLALLRVELDRLLELLARLGELAGVSTTLARLLAEYRRTVRRVRALQDVLLPELDADIADIETRLEDLEREDALTARGFGRLTAFAAADRPDARDAP